MAHPKLNHLMLLRVKPHIFVEDKSLVGNLRYIRTQLSQKHEQTFILKSRVDRLIKQKLMTSPVGSTMRKTN
jgi:hypothetical protein